MAPCSCFVNETITINKNIFVRITATSKHQDILLSTLRDCLKSIFTKQYHFGDLSTTILKDESLDHRLMKSVQKSKKYYMFGELFWGESSQFWDYCFQNVTHVLLCRGQHARSMWFQNCRCRPCLRGEYRSLTDPTETYCLVRCLLSAEHVSCFRSYVIFDWYTAKQLNRALALV